MWQTGADFKGRTAAAAGRKEGSVYAYPSLAVLRNEGKDSLNRCSGFRGWKSLFYKLNIIFHCSCNVFCTDQWPQLSTCILYLCCDSLSLHLDFRRGKKRASLSCSWKNLPTLGVPSRGVSLPRMLRHHQRVLLFLRWLRWSLRFMRVPKITAFVFVKAHANCKHRFTTGAVMRGLECRLKFPASVPSSWVIKTRGLLVFWARSLQCSTVSVCLHAILLFLL